MQCLRVLVLASTPACGGLDNLRQSSALEKIIAFPLGTTIIPKTGRGRIGSETQTGMNKLLKQKQERFSRTIVPTVIYW